MDNSMGRRVFLGAAATGMAAGPALAKSFAKNETIVIGIMGMGGRGTAHAKEFAKISGVEVAYVCDVDENRTNKAVEAVKQVDGKTPKGVGDFRRILDDKSVDALLVATCNHWHAPAAILGCTAGKHVYVEKPCSYTPHEGELLVRAARKNNKLVQMGNQRRSWPKIIEAIELVRNGEIGKAYFSRCMYSADRPTIGRGEATAVPAGLDYALWEGPAPHKPFHDNYLHYNWHWFWHWGNGELGNNGVHTIDVARWGLGTDFPSRVTSAGGRYRFQDDQETPDTHVVTYEFESGKAITWEGLSCNAFRPGGDTAEVVFYGETGSLAISGGGYSIYDIKGKVKKTVKGGGGDTTHQENFLAGIRNGTKLNSEIEEGHKSTLLCHLGNISQRTGRALRCDSKTGKILDDAQASGDWTREYAKEWEPKV